MAYEMTGKVKLLQDEQTFGSGFVKRELVLTVEDGKYPQEINIEFVQGQVALIENLKVDDDVTVTFDIRGREYNNRYFNNLVGWKIAVNGASSAPVDKPPVADDSDDIPF